MTYLENIRRCKEQQKNIYVNIVMAAKRKAKEMLDRQKLILVRWGPYKEAIGHA